MKINIVLEDLQAEFPHLIDKDRFECVETKEVGTWIVRKRSPLPEEGLQGDGRHL